MSFGTPATSTTTPGFSFGAQKPATGLGFGGSNFGATTQPTSSLTFGTSTPATTTTLNFNFGSTPSASTQPQLTSLLGSATSTTTTPSFFSTPTTIATPGTGLAFGTPASSTGLTFAAPTSISASGGLSFGAVTTSAPSFFGAAPAGGLFGAKLTTGSALPTTTAGRGLGGLDATVSKTGLAQGSNSPTAAKENLIPNELMQTIDSFKEFVKTQKAFASDIARGSSRPLNRCSEDTASLMEILTTLAGSVQRDRALADKLKQDTAKALQNAEIAQRTHDTPAGLQYENNAPLLFFMELAENFEQDLMLFRSQIEATEKHIQTMVAPKTLTPQELTTAMKKLHDSFIAVAGKLQGVHSKVQHQKEQYLNFRKYVLKDSSNVFEDVKSNGQIGRISTTKISSGPTPFGPGNKSFLSSTALQSGRPPVYGTSNSLVWGSATPTPSAANLTLGTAMKPPTASLNFNPPANLTAPLSTTDSSSSFQLQKPPVGNKRGKH